MLTARELIFSNRMIPSELFQTADETFIFSYGKITHKYPLVVKKIVVNKSNNLETKDTKQKLNAKQNITSESGRSVVSIRVSDNKQGQTVSDIYFLSSKDNQYQPVSLIDIIAINSKTEPIEKYRISDKIRIEPLSNEVNSENRVTASVSLRSNDYLSADQHWLLDINSCINVANLKEKGITDLVVPIKVGVHYQLLELKDDTIKFIVNRPFGIEYDGNRIYGRFLSFSERIMQVYTDKGGMFSLTLKPYTVDVKEYII